MGGSAAPELTHRERIRLALEHRETDRVPIAMACAGLNPPARAALEAHLRLVAVEGEPVGELGLHIERQFDSGVADPVGYANSQWLYLPVAHMVPEGGYEAESY